LLRFDFILKHVLGTKIRKIDRSSRRLDWKVRVESNNKNQKSIKEEWIQSLIKVIIEELEVDIVERIKRAKGKNEKVIRVVKEMKNTRVKTLRGNKW